MSRADAVTGRTIRRDQGAVIPMIGLLLPVLILMTAFAVDLGAQRSSRRQMQAVADVIALDMVRLADGRTTAEIILAQSTNDRLEESAVNNGIDPARVNQVVVEVVWGEYDATVQPLPFVPHHVYGSPPADITVVPDAVLITTTETTDYRFRPGSGTVTRSAVAGVGDEPQAQFLLGSTLVSMSPTKNWIVGRALRKVITDADLVGYQGLANARVSLRSLAADLGLGSPDELVDATVTFRRLMVATVSALEAPDGSADDKAAAVSVMNDLLSRDIVDLDVPLAPVLGLTTTGSSGLDGYVSIPQMLVFSVAVANGIHAISIPGSVLNVAGLASVTLDLSAIEAPIEVGTEHGKSDSTNQLALGVTIDVAIEGDKQQKVCALPDPEQDLLAALLGLVNTVDCLLSDPSELLEVDIGGTIDLDMTLGEVTGTQWIDCAASRLDIAYDTGPVDIVVTSTLGVDVWWDGTPLTLLGIAPVTDSARAEGESGSVAFQPTDVGPRHLAFEEVYPDGSTGGPTARVGSTTLGLANLISIAGVQVTVVNEDLPELGKHASNLVVPMLNNVLNEVDQQVVAEISRLLGLNLGGADITPQFMECEDNTVRLVG